MTERPMDTGGSVTASTDRNLILQQGFEPPATEDGSRLSSAIRFQPRLVLLIALAGTIWQLPELFGLLTVLLAWSALLPRWSPFDFLYHHTLGLRPGAPKLDPAPPPRRFSQGLAGTFAASITAALISGQPGAAWVLQAFLLIAVSAIAFGKFCLGSFLYHLLRGRIDFAFRTLPWGRGI